MILEVLFVFGLAHPPENVFGPHCDSPIGCEVALTSSPEPDIGSEPAPEPSTPDEPSEPDPDPSPSDPDPTGPAEECHEKDPNCWLAEEDR